MLARIAKADLGKHVAIPTKIAGSTGDDDILHDGFATARMHDHMVILQP